MQIAKRSKGEEGGTHLAEEFELMDKCAEIQAWKHIAFTSH